ncbi:MAG: exosortase system-associated protein, TIGR04073 family [Verrucomicrobia bacterium]|nr:exosortase system-associated protein, TIGR04073 family [Verrucomicrobiota bacterium]
MTRQLTILVPVVAGLILAGCSGPERKLGRGINNATELARLGEMRRSIEQTALWDGPTSAFTTGLIRGFNRSMARTALGLYDIVTFPFPPYQPRLTPEYRVYPDLAYKDTRFPYGGLRLTPNPAYPDSYVPNLLSDQIFATDTSLGFSGGDIAPMIIGSRFRIFDN